MGQKQRKGAEKREKQAKQKARAQAVEVAKQKHHLSRKKWAPRTIKEMVFVLCIAAVAVRTLRKFYARYAPLVRPAGAASPCVRCPGLTASERAMRTKCRLA